MNLLIDAVFFQFASSGIARVWKSILSHVAQDSRINLFIMDRGNAPVIKGSTVIPFPTYDLSRNTAADSILIQNICDLYNIDVFSSTYYTTPLRTPSALVVYDMIPELLEFDLSFRDWKEKKNAINYAQYHISISKSTRENLHQFYPNIDKLRSSFAHLAIDNDLFKQTSAEIVKDFRGRHDISRPYFLFVGSRQQHNNYKNAQIFFKAIEKYDSFDFEVVCVGGETTFDEDVTRLQARGLKIQRIGVGDDELAAAYAGAIALIYPSLYEGFGLPVLEAMASGCPVITTRRGSLGEVAGDAALFVDGLDAQAMRDALKLVGDIERRQAYVAKGLENVKRFSWSSFADHFIDVVHRLNEEARGGAYREFFERWAELRTKQADVDYHVLP